MSYGIKIAIGGNSWGAPAHIDKSGWVAERPARDKTGLWAVNTWRSIDKGTDDLITSVAVGHDDEEGF